MAAGLISETRQHSLDVLHINGMIYNPFITVAKSWGQVHTLINSGPLVENHFDEPLKVLINANAHYVIPKSKNFIGIEFNGELQEKKYEIVIRPQMRVALSDKVALGFTTGIPAGDSDRKLDFMIRLVYECAKKSKK